MVETNNHIKKDRENVDQIKTKSWEFPGISGFHGYTLVGVRCVPAHGAEEAITYNK